MARDNSPKIRQRAQLERKQTQRASYDRVLIVSEGSKTEPLYFKEIKNAQILQTANVEVHPSALGTEPIQVVRYAKQLFEAGDPHKRVRTRAFEKVFAIFDRDVTTSHILMRSSLRDRLTASFATMLDSQLYLRPSRPCRVLSCGCCYIMRTFGIRFTATRFLRVSNCTFRAMTKALVVVLPRPRQTLTLPASVHGIWLRLVPRSMTPNHLPISLSWLHCCLRLATS
jgi:hypothetical protein